MILQKKLTLKLRVSALNVIACLKPYGLAQPAQGSSKLFYIYWQSLVHTKMTTFPKHLNDYVFLEENFDDWDCASP